VAGITID